MKSLNCLFFYLCVPLMLCSQSTIKGTINNAVGQTLSLYVYPHIFGELGENLEITVDENHQFQFDTYPSKAIPAILQIADYQYRLFLFPEKTLQLDVQLDEQNRPLIIFEGAAAKDNQFYLQYQNVLYQEKQNRPQKLLEKFKPKDYLAYETNLKQRKTEFLQKYQSKIDKRLFNWLQNDILYEFANALFEYPNLDLIAHTPSKKYYRFLNEIKLNNATAILQPTYQRFLLEYTNYQLFKPQKWGRFSSTEKQFQFIRRYFFEAPLYFLQFSILKTNLSFGEAEKVEDVYRKFLNSKAPEGLKRQLQAVHQPTNLPIIGQHFSTNLLHNQNNSFYEPSLKIGNGKIYYIIQRPVQEIEFEAIKQLTKAVNDIKYLDFGLLSLVDSTAFPKELSATPQFWLRYWSLESYQKKFPIKEDAYFLLVNKYGQIIANIPSSINQVEIKQIVEFMVENNSRRVYSYSIAPNFYFR